MMLLEASKNFIMAILNEALIHGRTRISVRSDLLDMEILKLDLETNRIAWIAEPKDFDPVVSEIKLKLGNHWLEDDLPNFFDLRDAFQSSLMIKPSEFMQLIEEMKNIEERKMDPYRFPRQMLLAIDTNIAYNRLFSRLTLMDEMCRKGGLDSSLIPMLIPSLVEEEISKSVGAKYTSRDIDTIERALGKRLPGNLINCLGKKGRKAANAQAEIKIIEEKYSSISVSGGKFKDDKEERDRDIVMSVAEYCRAQDNDVLFVTADDKARAHCRAFRIPSVGLRYPYDLPKSMDFDPWLLVELLYDLSINFAIISLKGLGIRFQGTWAGKSIEEYSRERMCFSVEGGSDISKDIKKDHDVLCKISQAVDLKHII
ncbi:MAG: hypothetical protein GKC03_06720 [Methanomassiliicoccales archaeon]|nr:hypothetical protein [Methanomassiliicoccales archaeon]